MIEAAVTVNLLPMGNKPESERQARPLTKLKTPEETRRRRLGKPRSEKFSEHGETAPGKAKNTSENFSEVIKGETLRQHWRRVVICIVTFRQHCRRVVKARPATRLLLPWG